MATVPTGGWTISGFGTLDTSNVGAVVIPTTENLILNGNVDFNLSADATYTGVISNGTSTTAVVSKHGNSVLTMSGNNTWTGQLDVGAGELVISDAQAFPAVATSGTVDVDQIRLDGGKLTYSGTAKHELPAETGIDVRSNSTIRLNATGNTNNTLTINGPVKCEVDNISLDLEGKGTLTNGSSDGTEVPSTIRFSGASTALDLTLNVRRGVTMDIDGVTVGSAGNSVLNIYGDLRGNGTFTGGAMNVEPNGRILPGSLVDTTLNVIVTDTTNGLQLKKGCELWVSFDDDGVDELNVTGLVTATGTGTVKVYNIAYTESPLVATPIIRCSATNTLAAGDFEKTDYLRAQIATTDSAAAAENEVGNSTITVSGNNVQLAVS